MTRMYAVTQKHGRLSIIKIKEPEIQLKTPKINIWQFILNTRIPIFIYLFYFIFFFLEMLSCFQTQETLKTFINTFF